MSGEYSIFGTAPDATGRPLTVVIADDQALVRGGFRLILKAAGINVVAEAADGAQAVAAVREHRPDVVLMDVRMPVMDGIEATKGILADVAATDAAAGAGGAAGAAPTRIIILTTFDLDEYVYAALTAGASGFLLKDVTPEHLVAAVQLVRTGDALLAPSITRRLVERFAAAPDTAGQGKPARPGRPGGPACRAPGQRRLRHIPADPPRDGGTRPGRPRPVQRGDRVGADLVRGDGEDPRGPHPHQAQPPRPRPGGRPRLRDRPRLPGNRGLIRASRPGP